MKIIKNKNKQTKTKLSSFAKINTTNIDKNVTKINYLDIANAKSGQILEIKNIQGKNNFPSRAKRVAKVGDSVFSTVRPNLRGFTKIKDEDLVVSTGFAVVSPNDQDYSDFLYYALSSNKALSWMLSICEGGNYPAFKSSSLVNFSLIDISKNDALKIGQVLSQQEGQINKIKKLIEKLEKRNQYYAERLLSGELRVREGRDGAIEFYENEEWTDIKLNHYLKKEDFQMPSDWVRGIFSEHSNFTVGTPLHARNFNYEKNGFQYLRTGDVWDDASSSKEIAYYNGEVEDKFIKNENDYLISLKGYNDKIGKGTLGLVTNYENKKGIVCDNMYLVKKKEIDLVEYTAYVTKLNYVQNLILRTAVGSTARFATKMINKIEWVFPNNESEMLLINSILKNFEKELSKLRKIREKEQKRFDWMSDALLSGEYQVID